MDNPAATMGSVAASERFELQRQTSALVDGHRLRFDAVLEDSRCPANVTCVWEGRATVSLTFTRQQSVHEVQLQIPGYVTAETEPREGQITTAGGYTFVLLALDPYPGTVTAEDMPAPTATLIVTPQ